MDDTGCSFGYEPVEKRILLQQQQMLETRVVQNVKSIAAFLGSTEIISYFNVIDAHRERQNNKGVVFEIAYRQFLQVAALP